MHRAMTWRNSLFPVVIVVASLTACASKTGTVAAPATVTALPVGASGGSQRGVGLEVTSRNDGQQITVEAAASAVFDQLEASYEALAIPLSRRDPTSRILGNEGLKMRRELGKIQMRKAFDCGGSAGMPNAETYTLTASIMSTVAGSDANISVVTTIVDASAENPSYPGSGVRCSSTGVFEEALAKELKSRLDQR